LGLFFLCLHFPFYENFFSSFLLRPLSLVLSSQLLFRRLDGSARSRPPLLRIVARLRPISVNSSCCSEAMLQATRSAISGGGTEARLQATRSAISGGGTVVWEEICAILSEKLFVYNVCDRFVFRNCVNFLFLLMVETRLY
jgi:hypothetical protein